MSATIDITESAALAVLRTFLLGILPAGVEVIKAQVNRVPQPTAPDFVLMTPLVLDRLATNVSNYTDGYPGSAQTRSTWQSTQFTVQLDVHGPASLANVQIITTLFKDSEAAVQFALSGLAIAPLFASAPRQAPFVNAEQQVDTRWTVDLAMQIKPIVTMSQDFADAVTIGVREVDATFPPA